MGFTCVMRVWALVFYFVSGPIECSSSLTLILLQMRNERPLPLSCDADHMSFPLLRIDWNGLSKCFVINPNGSLPHYVIFNAFPIWKAVVFGYKYGWLFLSSSHLISHILYPIVIDRVIANSRIFSSDPKARNVWCGGKLREWICSYWIDRLSFNIFSGRTFFSVSVVLSFCYQIPGLVFVCHK